MYRPDHRRKTSFDVSSVSARNELKSYCFQCQMTRMIKNSPLTVTSTLVFLQTDNLPQWAWFLISENSRDYWPCTALHGTYSSEYAQEEKHETSSTVECFVCKLCMTQPNRKASMQDERRLNLTEDVFDARGVYDTIRPLSTRNHRK